MAEVTRIEPDKKVPTFIGWFRDSYRRGQPWRQEALESFAFVNGEQWDEAVCRDLDKEGRPHLTINKLLPQVETLSGLQRSNRLDIRALPRGSKDAQSADLMSNLIEYTVNRSNGDYEQSECFDNGVIGGLGTLEVLRNYDDDLEGELLIRSCDPLQIFPDPEFRRADWDDARFVMKAPFKDPEELVFAFGAQGPDMAGKIRAMCSRMKNDDWLTAFGVDQTLTGNIRQELGEAFFNTETKKVRVLEVYYRTTKRVAVVVAPDGEVIPVETGIGSKSAMEVAEAQAKAMRGYADTRRVKVVRIATLLGWELLQDVPSPFPTRRFPIVPYFPLLIRNQFHGLTHHQKDPQREINKRRSQLLHHLNTSANSGWINGPNGADPAFMAANGSKPGVIINHQGEPPTQIQPPQLPPGLFQLESLAERDIGQIGVPDELMGQGNQKFISGRAKQATQFGGQVRVTRYFDQLRLTRKILGELLVSIIPRMYSERKIREIVDQEVSRAPDGSMASLVEQAQNDEEAAVAGLDPVDALIARARKLRYDIVVEDAPTLPTQRQAAFQQLMQLATLMPGVLGPEEILEHSDIKNKDELIAKVAQRAQAMQAQGLPLQDTARGADRNSERLDVGDMGQQAQLLTGGQIGAGGE